MNALNQVLIEGNVVRDPIRKETPNGKHLCTLPIAVNRYYKGSSGDYVNEVGYFDIEVWGDAFASPIQKYAHKGRGVRVVGRLKQNRWKGQDGKQASKVSIVAEHLEFKFPPKGSSAASSNDSPSDDGDESDSTYSDAQEAAQGIRQEVMSEETVF